MNAPDMQTTIFGTEIPAPTVTVPAINLGRWHLAILERLLLVAPMSDDELIASLGKSGNTLRPRRLELQRHLYIEATEQIRTPSGRKAWRYSITERGVKAVEAANREEQPR